MIMFGCQSDFFPYVYIHIIYNFSNIILRFTTEKENRSKRDTHSTEDSLRKTKRHVSIGDSKGEYSLNDKFCTRYICGENSENQGVVKDSLNSKTKL